jgi:hypothetical protein
MTKAARLFDVVIPEACAPDIAARHIDAEIPPKRPRQRPTITVISALNDIQMVLTQLCLHAGYPAEPAPESGRSDPRGIVVWDVPVLESHWSEKLARWSRNCRVIASIGFPDRELVTLAKDAGAFACVEWPCEPADLEFVLDRAAIAPAPVPADARHAVPPTPALLRRIARGEVATEPREG